MIEPEVTVRGPLFDGRAVVALADFIDEAEDRVADDAVRRIRQRLGQVLKNPTGFYESRIANDRVRGDSVVDDSGVVYGPWLEGTSSRNQTTRFRGYATFRLTAQQVQADAHDLAERVLPRFLARMQ